MGKSLGKKIAKIVVWTVVSVLLLVLAIPALLYVPFIQDFVKDIAVKEASKSTGMDIDVEQLRLRWPLRLSVDGVRVVEADGDTMLTAGRLDVGVKILPLLRGDIDVNYARLDSAFYQMGNSDSLMWLRARVDRLEVNPAQLKMNMERIALSDATLDGADIRLIMRPDTAATPVDTTASKPMLITADLITLRRVNYTMSMLPTIDSLSCSVPLAQLRNGEIDLTGRKIHARSLAIDSVSATYLTPSEAWLKANPPVAAAADTVVTPQSEMWTITADSLRLTGRRAVYATKGVRPLPGLDMSYLSVSDIDIEIDSFYNRGTSIRVPLRRLAATERCGLTLEATGTFEMDSAAMRANDFKILTNHSSIALNASMGMGDLSTDPSLPLMLQADARLSLADVMMAMPSMRPMLSKFPAPALVNLQADIHGTPRRLTVESFKARYPGMLNLSASGTVDNPMDPASIGGDLNIDGSLRGSAALNRSLTAARLLPGINLPHTMTVKGHVKYQPMKADANLVVTANDGRVALKGYWNGRTEAYDAGLDIRRFPVQAFMPALGVENLTATVAASGHGYNPMSRNTAMHVNVAVADVTYRQQPLRDIQLVADLSGGNCNGRLSSGNEPADLDVDFIAALTDSGMTWDIDGTVRHLDLLQLGIMTDTCSGSLALTSKGLYNPRTRYLDAVLTLNDVDWTYGPDRITAPRTDLRALMSDSLTSAGVNSGDLAVSFSSPFNLDSIMQRFTATSQLVDRQIKLRNLDVDSLQRTLPPFSLMMELGPDNPASEYLAASSKIMFDRAAMTASNDSLLSLTAGVTGFESGSTRLDSINFSARQHGHYLVYSAMINNEPGTMDNFAHITLNGFMGRNRLSAILNQRNIKNDTGFSFGFSAGVSDSVLTVKLAPYTPTIAYRRWTLNPDNHIAYNLFTRHIDADLSLTDSISSVRIFSTAQAETDSIAKGQTLNVQLADIRLQDWLSFSPWAPPLSGSLSADMKINLSPTSITGDGRVGLHDFFYNKERVGNFDADVNVNTDPRTGMLRADMALLVDSVKTVTVSGTLNDSITKSPFLLDFKMIHFPLRVANPFLPEGVAKLSGMLNGQMDITGEMAHPVFNGWLNFDSTAVNVTMLGTDFKFSDEKIPVDSGIVSFNDFTVTGCNDNPLLISGKANLRDLSNVALDLSMKANNMMIVNSTRARNGADAYGKAYIDLDAAVKGDMQVLFVNADLALLSGTNVTYVVPASTSTISSTAGDVSKMVHFVSFNDSVQVVQADSVARSMAMILTAGLTIQDGTVITVNLSPDGSSKAQVEGSGSFDFSMNPLSNGRLTGRYTISKGMARYNVPMLGEKSFDLLDGSYIAFNGDMMNPLLNLKAVDKMKANVTQSGQNSRVITFDVGLSVTGSLESMNVVFDLSTDDDITVQNELQSMSPEQRASQAMNLLLYNTYTGPGTSATSNLTGNPLYSFLESKVNSWMANNVKGVDISFGIDQYNRTYEGASSTTTSYSYQVSKSLFDDRFKILVGGNYSTDANADENFSQNLISDISFEYLLNRSGSMYVRIFRHTGYESILEGEVTSTGVGFVLKRKLNTLRDLFRFRRRKPSLVLPADNRQPSPQSQEPTSSSTPPPPSTTDETAK